METPPSPYVFTEQQQQQKSKLVQANGSNMHINCSLTQYIHSIETFANKQSASESDFFLHQQVVLWYC